MWLSLFISILLLATIGGVSHPSAQSFSHALLTVFCLLAGQANALDPIIALSCMVLSFLSGIILSILLRKQSFSRSFRELFSGLFFVILIVSLTVSILPPSLPRLEYGIVLSIILIGMVYSVLGKTVGGQIMGIACALNALSVVVGLNGRGMAFIALAIFYSVFLIMSFIVVSRLRHY
ncbi:MULTISPECIES: hypothetical protein [Commensalibacter]|uniref:Uncharacterized protein n=1 Tax=Commensalibacter papalotli (ex Servin-Garciduenas et al. 2014) TaxID=1208583 RepID=W7DTK3_9PROT|nr:MULTISPECIES: hypothetical protein [Commensalibacter]EUK18250.1 hypothetical protein COMX_00830 [Commensalibacter papalotli (ex Servin-Garciduenas et al. 2014)]CAI3936898.1 unnamed protein product [Commensalibacter papalotli (ex Botero et al. 2024)]